MERDYDILIAGAGPVGLTLAAAMDRGPHRVAIVDSGEVAPSRPIALSLGSCQLLRRLGAWSDGTGTPILSVHVSQQDGIGRCLMRHSDIGERALGQVVSYAALRDRLHPLPGAGRIRGLASRWDVDEEALTLYIDDGTGSERRLRTRLLVLAEGGRQLESSRERDYGQSALVGAALPEHPPEGRAWERFTPQGPLALLPHGDRYAMVWSARHETIAALRALDGRELAARLESAAGRRVGRIRAVSDLGVFPLSLRRAAHPGPRALAIGNASQSLHPVAGQGLNLGLRDAWELAMLLNDHGGADPGDPRLLRRYLAARGLDRGHAVHATDLLVRLFSNDHPAMRAARGAGLLALDMAGPLRNFLARRMMFGMRALP